jgi:hypothetical protein
MSHSDRLRLARVDLIAGLRKQNGHRTYGHFAHASLDAGEIRTEGQR